MPAVVCNSGLQVALEADIHITAAGQLSRSVAEEST